LGGEVSVVRSAIGKMLRKGSSSKGKRKRVEASTRDKAKKWLISIDADGGLGEARGVGKKRRDRGGGGGSDTPGKGKFPRFAPWDREREGAFCWEAKSPKGKKKEKREARAITLTDSPGVI